ncbi:Na+/H+ antiporter subunit A [Ornithinimicrobium cryptoxanthini]|uniref:Na+/H+ antiporter subunit A n=1 Tax=Ornithinimicrobium cryptoxanthini TaxID=2934161 RepID=A0ABY4YIH7_9MICO|nr:Na+/H+ antiporter subunit A [Ornithinimicrobium cryptoxanthini]USQ76305.1 Na+/H+ antiporter subunit A [Ornithinimicrobium cryptoxanthini]
MLVLVAVHAVAGILAPMLVRLMGARAFVPLAAVPAFTAGYAAWQYPAISSGRPPTETFTWISELDLSLNFRMDTLAWLMTLIVSAVGALVLLYCAHYFDDRERGKGLGLFAGSLTAFAGAMLGLVTTDDMLLLYVFWEITTILSYLLIGYVMTSKASIAAAKQALLVTTFGGLAMLVGIVMIGETQDTYLISELLANPGSGPWITGGVVLLIVGAVSKSALVPFHFWLPGAMAAPTPVSAYLHAAAMVKAGVYLVARFAPAYADLAVWRYLVIILGGYTMLLGGYRALRQYDLKLLLAYGTVSQLGFITLLVGFGTQGMAMAGLGLLLSHSLFKSCLFLTVGTVEHATGTRDVRRLSGIGRRMPWLTAGAILAALSMAGVGPVLGFAAKETAIDALLHPDGGWETFDVVVLLLVALGSVLTFGYSARFVWGAFARKDPALAGDAGQVTTVSHPPERLLVAVPGVLGLAGLVAGLASPLLEVEFARYASAYPVTDHEPHLALWSGFVPALGVSALIWVLGSLLFLGSAPVAHLQRRLQVPLDAGRVYQQLVRGVDRLALEVTGGFQRGSLPTLLAIILVVLVTLPTVQLVRGVTWPDDITWFDRPAQVGVGVVVVFAAIAATRARRRLRAVFLVSVTGYGTAMLFLLHGAPDLALTQVLVETVTLVVFVLVIRRLSGRFPDDPSVLTRRLRAVLGVAVGAVVAAVAMTAVAVRSQEPSARSLIETAKEYGGGDNIVNVILVDVRAWDTMGELSVVLAAATGVTSLIFLKQDAVVRARRALRQTWRNRSTAATEESGGQRWIAAAQELDPSRRSTIFEVVTRLVFHTIVLWSVYLLFSGHNSPGGGFAAGLVAGLALALRYLAGRGYELRVALPVMPGLLLGGGLFLAAASAILPMFFGSPPLRTWIFDVPIPIIGDVHVVTSLLFDLGVYLVVVGLMLDILRSLGSSLDEQIAQEGE